MMLDGQAADPAQIIADLRRERDEALAREAALAEVLRVVNASPGDLAAVFDAMLERAIRLCDAQFGFLMRYKDGKYALAAQRGLTPELADYMSSRLDQPAPGESNALILQGRPYVHNVDLKDQEPYRAGAPLRRAIVDLGGARTGMAVALRKDDELLGTFSLLRAEVRPFTDEQIALLQNFAAQAVIAMENARLLTETREALEQQKAMAEVLQVINASPGDLAPVFDAMLEKAMRLCDAAFGLLLTREGDIGRLVAQREVPQTFLEFLIRTPIKLKTVLGPNFRDGPLLHIADLAAGAPYRDGVPLAVAAVDLGGIRSFLSVPLIKDGALIGIFAIYRQEVRPFADNQIALLQNFAAQAVIAMEDARLLNETRAALERETAVGEVLKVIGRSAVDLDAVLHTVVTSAIRLCRADHAVIYRNDGGQYRWAAGHSLPRDYEQIERSVAITPGPGTLVGRVAMEGRVVQITDAWTDPLYAAKEDARVGGVHSMLGVPLLRDGMVIGVIGMARGRVEPYSEREIELVATFADQAVIAIENARLITETRAALEQQTATAEVLQVINRSPGDLAPVFDAMLDRALRLCEGQFGGLWTIDGDRYLAVALKNVPPAYAAFLRDDTSMPGPGTAPYRFLQGERFVHNLDMADEEPYRHGDRQRRALVDLGGARSALQVPLRKDNTVLGVITVYRQEVRPFSDKQIALLQNFAEQAVIAIESARLITETREALEQQTATAEVLQVINSSPGDLAPVFDSMLEKAMRLCEASFGFLTKIEGKNFRAVALRGASPAFAEVFRQPQHIAPGQAHHQLMQGANLVHVEDFAAESVHHSDDPALRALADLADARTGLCVALRSESTLLGAIVLYRKEVRRFSDKQIALLQNFAEQAVIAIESARLITETREALEQQTATAELLQVINSSPGELQPVFEAMLEKATRLCEAAFGILLTHDGTRFRHAALRAVPAGYAEYMRKNPPLYRPGTGPARILDGERLVHVLDAMDTELYRSGDPNRRALVDLAGARSLLLVPLLKDDTVLGVITIYRQEVRPFTDNQIALLQNFAAQAVIAMDNARLLDEIRQRQAELRVTFDNMGDGVAMFDAGLRLAAWNRNFQRILDLPDTFVAERPSYADYVQALAERGEFDEDFEVEISRRLMDTDRELRIERTRPDGRVIEVRRNAVPGGGFVLIYSDVTERKRAEEAVRAARDSAEAALAELKTTQASLMHAQKMAALGQLTAGIAHEIKNPLNFVNNFAGLSVDLLGEMKGLAAPGIAALDDDVRSDLDEVFEMLTSNLEKIAEHGKRADGIVKSMLAHSRGTSGERQTVDLNALVEEALNLAYHGARAQDQEFNITLERDLAAGIAPVELVPQDVLRVFLNLIGNGFHAAHQRRKAEAGFRPTLSVATRDLGKQVEVRVRDNGIGIPREHRDKLFQPFFTTKPPGEGTGLGLSISYDIVTQQHGGTITVESEEGRFTEFTVRLPRAVPGRARVERAAGRAA